jgi:RNA polymerase sigma factor (sigma-70 family)
VRRGDDRAFEELYSRYRRRIAAYVLGMVGDHGRAEDLTQEVFISALRRMRDSERPIAFKAWIYEIAKNACIDEFRRTRRAQEVPLDTDDETSAGERGLLSRAPTPDVAVESRQQLTDLRGAFRGLSESHHKILVLRELEGLSYTEIGERMGMSRPVVESTLFRARRRLSEEYEELVSGRRCEHVQTVITARSARRGRALGIREQRLLARHLAHCQPCRRQAHLAGFDDSALQPTGLIGKIAVLLPFPLLPWRRGAKNNAAASAPSHRLDALHSMQTISTYAGPSSPFSGLGRAAAAAATLVIAGAGGGAIVAGVGSHSSASHGPAQSSPGASVGGSASGSSSSSSAGAASRGSSAGAASGTGPAKGAGAGSSAANGAGGSTSIATTASGRPAVGAAVPGTLSGAGPRGGKADPAAQAASDPAAPGAAGSSSSSGSSGGTGSTAPVLTLPTPTSLPGLPGAGALPTVAVPQPSSLGLPKPGALLGKVLGSVPGVGAVAGLGGGSGSSGGSSSSTGSGSSTNSGSGTGTGTGSGGSSSSSTGKGVKLGDPTSVLAPITSKLKGS